MTKIIDISIQDVSFSYTEPLILDHVNLDIYRGEFLGIVGPNGGGKSTLLKLILGLLQPTNGKITVLGNTPKRGRSRIGYVPQYASFERDFPITVFDTVLLGKISGKSKLFGYTKQDLESAKDALQVTETDDLQDRLLNTLSGGQLQRVLIARALASNPDLLILDEPTSNVDMRMEEDIFEILERLNARSTIIVVSHDIGFISEYVTRVACLNQTLICHDTAAITGETIEKLYGGGVHMIQHSHSH